MRCSVITSISSTIASSGEQVLTSIVIRRSTGSAVTMSPCWAMPRMTSRSEIIPARLPSSLTTGAAPIRFTLGTLTSDATVSRGATVTTLRPFCSLQDRGLWLPFCDLLGVVRWPITKSARAAAQGSSRGLRRCPDSKPGCELHVRIACGQFFPELLSLLTTPNAAKGLELLAGTPIHTAIRINLLLLRPRPAKSSRRGDALVTALLAAKCLNSSAFSPTFS